MKHGNGKSRIVKVHLSIANHPSYGHIFADPLLRGVIVGIWVIAARAHVSATDDDLTLTPSDILWITGKARMVDAAKQLRKCCEAVAYPTRTCCDKHANCDRSSCHRPARWVIQVRNFSRKQGFTPQTPAESPHNSASSEEPKNQRTDIAESAIPPCLFGDPSTHSQIGPEKDKYQIEFENEIKPVYPKRGGDYRWREALGYYRAARKDGESLEAIRAGVLRYGRWVAAKGLLGTDKVKQAASFLGREKCWLEPWTVSQPSVEHSNGGYL